MIKRVLLIVILIVLTLSLSIIFRYALKNPNKNNSIPLTEKTPISHEEEVSSGSPIRLKIPKINVDANIQHVGLTSDWAMDIPKNPKDVAWFDLGTRPGDKGSSVISGHFGWKNNIPAVFDNLHKLRKGDMVYIEDDKGETITFVVRESRIYDSEADTSNIFGSIDGASHLNLITCEGNWNETQKSYPNRLVVFTDKKI